MTALSSDTYIIRLKLSPGSEALSHVLQLINELEAHVDAIDTIHTPDDLDESVTRDITISTMGEHHAGKILDALEKMDAVEIRYMSDRTFLMHLGGKIEVKSKFPISNRDELSMAYTPGVARVCTAIHNKPKTAFNLTIKKNMVAVVSDGTAVLGLGDIGPLAALPVMEGKAMLLKEFANVDAFPICLDTTDIETVIDTVKYIAPSFGAINLEDISAPRCFDIENRLKDLLDIPVFHDDQHGTAAVMTAALVNALKIVNKQMNDIRVVFNGVGAAGTACTNMLIELGVQHIIGCDRQGILHRDRDDLNSHKRAYAEKTNPDNLRGTVYDAIKGADVFVGLSGPDILDVQHLKTMNKDAIVFAMANPVPEIMPELASEHVAIVATGRSDYPNQINNLLAFPGILRGALDCQAKDINPAMNIAAAYAIADTITDKDLAPDYIVPSVFNQNVVNAVASAVKRAARATRVARK